MEQLTNVAKKDIGQSDHKNPIRSKVRQPLRNHLGITPNGPDALDEIEFQFSAIFLFLKL